MSRKADIQAEETALNSPLRRSSRRTTVTNSPAPAALSSRRNSQSQTEATETKPPKTRRASQSQENVENNETTETKAAPRGRRASTAKEDTEEKTESTKIRSRRSSAATEPATEEPEKKSFITRRRKSTAAEEQAEPESVKPIRSRRSSVKDTVVEEDTAKKPTRSSRNSTKEETKEDPPKKILRSRRSSAAEENPEIEAKEKKPPTRGRRASTDKHDDEADTKLAKLTPIKSKRRLSVTENAANLDPIVELESETKARKSTSPQNSELKKVVVNLTDIKFNKEAKTNLDLSTIDESSFTEESLNKTNSEKKTVTPRKSPRLNKEKKINSDSLTPNKSSTMDKSVDKECSPKQIKEINKIVGEINSEEHTQNESAKESLENASSSLCKKLHFESETTEEINTVELAEAKEIDIKEEENIQTANLIQDKPDSAKFTESKETDIKEEENVQTDDLIQDKSDSHTESIDNSILEAECDQEKEYHKQLVLEKNRTSNPDATSESDESFKFSLHVSNSEIPDDNVEDVFNTSKNSNSSDKENIEINSTKDLNESNVNVTTTPKKLKTVIENSNPNIQNVVCRVSNVFRPNMKENSFMEPMEVDESFLDITQSKKLLDLDESVIKNGLPVVSTPIVKRCVEKIVNKEDFVELKGDEEEIEVSKINRLNEKESVIINASPIVEKCVEEIVNKKDLGELKGDEEEIDQNEQMQIEVSKINQLNEEESVIKNTSLIVERCVEEIVNKEDLGELKGDEEEIDQNEHTEIEVSKTDQLNEEESVIKNVSPIVERCVEAIVSKEDLEELDEEEIDQNEHTEIEVSKTDQLNEEVSVIKNVPPVSSPIVERCVEEIVNKEDLGELKGDEEEIDQNEHTEIEVSKTDQLNEEESVIKNVSPIVERCVEAIVSKEDLAELDEEEIDQNEHTEIQVSKTDQLNEEEYGIKNVPPVVSPGVERCVEEIVNKDLSKLKGDEKEIDQNEHKQIEVSRTDQLIEESGTVSEVITVGSEVTLEESEGINISKQESPKFTQRKFTIKSIDIKRRKPDKMTCRQASKMTKPLPKADLIVKLANGHVEHVDRCKSPRSEEELERNLSDKPSERSSFDSRKVETRGTSQNANIDQLEKETEQSQRNSKSPQPDHPSDKLKPQESTKSMNKPSEDLEMEQNSEKKSPRELRSLVEGQTEMDENKKSTARKSKSPQTQIIKTGDLKSENKKPQLLKPRSISLLREDMPEDEMENLDEELIKDKKCPRRSRSPHEEVTEEKGISSSPKESHMSELNDSSKQITESVSSPRKLSDSESETEIQTLSSPVKREHSLLESPEFKELGKMNISVDYEFEMPSDEEETNKFDNLQLEDTVKSKSEFADSIIEQSSSTLKRKSLDYEMEQGKKIKLTQEIEKNVQDHSRYATGCEETSSDELPIPEEMMVAEPIVEVPTNESVMLEDNNESVTDDSIARDNLASTQNIPESNVNKSKNDNELLSATEKEFLKESLKEHISVQNEVADSSISAEDTNEKANTSTSEITSIEMKPLEKSEAELENISDVKKRNKIKNKSKTTKKSSVESTEVDASMENACSNIKTVHTNEEIVMVESDCRDVIQDSSDMNERKKSKKKSEIGKLKQNETCKEKKSQLDESTGDTSVAKSSSTQKKSKKVSHTDKKENNYDDSAEKMKTVKKSDKSKKVPVVDKNKSIESEKKKKTEKSVGASNEEVFSSGATKKKNCKKQKNADISASETEEDKENRNRKEKNYKTQKKADITASETEEDKENRNRMPHKQIENVDLCQVSSSIKQKSKGLDTSTKSKSDKYHSSKMRNEYTYSEEEDSSEEENDLIITMAEEGEESTPSDDSNDIIDEGESIGFSDSEEEPDDSYDRNDPFICDDEEEELLSGKEYDLGYEKRKKTGKKSRIIKLDDYSDDIIQIKRKEKPTKKNKRSRIISVSDSSGSEVDIENTVSRFSTNSLEDIGSNDINDVIILEEKSTPIKLSDSQMIPELNNSFNASTLESSTKKRKKSIIIHENVNVTEFKNTEFSEKIASMVDTFCDSIYDGEISLNFSLEHAVDTTGESSKHDVFAKRTKRDGHFKMNLNEGYDSRESEKGNDSKKQKLSVTLDNIEDSDELNKSSRRRRSASLDNLSTSKSKKSKISRAGIEKKKNLVKTSHSKKKMKSQKRHNGTKPPTNSPDDLGTQTFSIMNQLITDVKNRPVRTIKPSTTVTNMNGSWVSEVADVKPSTTLSNRPSTTAEYKAGKIHPKDFRSKMLYDSSRVRRVDTKTLLRKKGAYF